MFVHRSNRGEPLVGALADIVRVPAGSALTPECIVVQSRGIERWLGNELARRLGVWANADFCYPRRLLERLTHEPGVERDDLLFEPETMTWSVAEVLASPLVDNPACEPLRRYLGNDPNARRRVGLAQRIAEVFDHYQVYRGEELLRRWERGAGDDWQSLLWRELVDRAGSNGPFGQRLAPWLADDAPAPPLSFPRRVSVFGVSTLPPAFLRVLTNVGRHIEVHLFLLSPTREFWADLRPDEPATFTLSLAPSEPLPRKREGLPDHRLLASLGRVGREFHGALEQTGYRDGPYDLFVDPGTSTALALVQSDILHLRVRGHDPAHPPALLGADDSSVGVHVCHSPLREVQVVHDQLRDRLERDPSLFPRDIIVLAPDIDVYTPYIEAVFGSAAPHPIPYQIADRSGVDDSGYLHAFLRVLDGLSGRITAPDVIDLLGLPPVAQRFQLDDDQLHRLRAMVADLGVRWGIDADDRVRHQLPADAAHTWRAALDRLLLGHAVAHDQAPFGSVTPYPYVEGEVTHIVAQLGEFVQTLATFHATLTRLQPVASWVRWLRELASAVLTSGDEHQREHDRLVAAVGQLAERSQAAGCTSSFGFDGVRSQLERCLRADSPARPFLAGGITFCQLTPMRSVPFRVVAILGLADEAFPRTRRSPSFDLIARHLPRPLDRSARHDDRYLFLEAILAARDALILTYPGKSPHDTRERPPSTVVSELLELLDQSLVVESPAENGRRGPTRVRDQLVTEHPLHPFGAAYFHGENPRLFTYADRYQQPSGKVSPRTVTPRFFRPTPHQVELASREVSLRELTAFFRHPQRTWLRDRLGVRLIEPHERLQEYEPAELDPLATWALGQSSLEAALHQVPLERELVRARAAGQLPHGAFGELALRRTWRVAERLAATVLEHDGRPAAPAEPRRFRLELGHDTLVGTLSVDHHHRLFRHQFSRRGGAGLVELWLAHLVASALGWLREPSVLVARGPQGPSTICEQFDVCHDAASHLAQLLAWYRVGAYGPLPFLPRTSLAAAERMHAGRSRNTEYADERDLTDPYVNLAFRPGLRLPAELPSSLQPIDEPPPDLTDPAAALARGDLFVHLARVVCGPLLTHRQSP